MNYLLSIPLLLAATYTAAACPTLRPEDAPVPVDGMTATQVEMQASQDAANQYVEEIRLFLECNAHRLHDLEHNYYVHQAFTAAETYNAELQEFRGRDTVAGR